MMDFNEEQRLREITRRHFFRDCRVGLGSMALGSLLAAENPWLQKYNRPDLFPAAGGYSGPPKPSP